MRSTKRTRNIKRYLGHLSTGQVYYLGLPISADVKVILTELGFSNPLRAGESILPPASSGAASRRNANGIEIIHPDKPKETRYRQIEWTWTEFRGRDQRAVKTGIKDVPYLRYPRTVLPPYSIELEIRQRMDGNFFLTTGPFHVQLDKDVRATSTANMLIETFQAFEVLDENLISWLPTNTKRLNWELLPPGRNPWANARPALNSIVSRQAMGNQPVIQARFDAVGQHSPEFVAVGLNGFSDYIVFGFPSQRICILESCQVNNATYVLNSEDWEEISQKSKVEILDARAHRTRLIHTRGWFAELADLFGDQNRLVA